jgi:GT2 family glycosyltransferase
MAEVSPFFISVVIVNYNGVPFLERCLTSLAAQTYAAYEIILVDNASTDDSCAWVEKNFPRVHLVRSATNIGFAAGNNLGFQHARGEWIATLNTDTCVERDYLEKLSAPMAAAQDAAAVGACAPLMLEMEHPDIVDAAGIRVDRFGFAWNVGAGEKANQFTTSREVYGACAGAALYRRAMLDQIGFFDAAYFGFYEDADLAWRARKAGWKTMFVPQARVYHLHGASFGKISPRKTYLLARNRWWTTLKNFPRASLALHLPLILILDLASLFQAARRGHFQEAWRGRVDAWRGWREIRN